MTGSSTVERPSVRLRADAYRNRERIVAAARDALVEHGVEVSLDEIARRAGIGNATLYRHFPDRWELIRTVVLSVLTRAAEQGEAALAEEPDPFEALRRFVHNAADERIGALCPLLSDWVDKDSAVFRAARLRLEDVISAIVAAAQQSGGLRTDVAVGDILLIATQLTRPLPGRGCMDLRGFMHRHLELLLDGLRTPRPSALPGPAATIQNLRQSGGAEGSVTR
jgi:AcrR family transcriptional regulator